jgi:hypothetical protein
MSADDRERTAGDVDETQPEGVVFPRGRALSNDTPCCADSRNMRALMRSRWGGAGS